MIKAAELRAKIAEFLWGPLTLDQFDEWFSENSWNMHRDSEPEAQEIAGAVELLLAEHSSGHLADNDLILKLLSLADRSTLFIEASRAEVNTTTPAPGVYSPSVMPGRRIGRYSFQFGSPIGSGLHRHKVTGTRRIDIGGTRSRLA